MNLHTLQAVLKTAFTKQMFQQLRLAAISHARADPGNCAACGYQGKFGPFGVPVRSGAICPECFSLERQRLLALAFSREDIKVQGRDILHFAGESSIARMIRSMEPKSYRVSEYGSDDADLSLDLESIELPDNSADLVIANHVLEHVDDRKAFAELYRILRPDGELVCMVPVVEGWSETYENPNITSERERERHFGQFDHIRYYGSDLRDRIRQAGFALREITAGPADVLTYRLCRGEKVFIGLK